MLFTKTLTIDGINPNTFNPVCDHIYKMDYDEVLQAHKDNKSYCSSSDVPLKES